MTGLPLVEARWDDARAALAMLARPLPATRLPLEACDGLVLAEELTALTALPAFDTSAMDGWAVSGTGPWTIVGASLAGRPAPGPLSSGQAVVIATGAVVPPGADAVVRSEDGTVSANRRTLDAPTPQTHEHVRPAGEECRDGETLAQAGTPVTPALIGLAAAAGHDKLAVIPRPSAALILFGDELATSGVAGPGLVRDSLGPQIPAWLARMGVDVLHVERCADTLDAHVEAIRRASTRADVVLTTGGTAAGPVDHLHAAIDLCQGRLEVDTVAVRPGHPMLAARIGSSGTWLVGLPGNPQSAIVTLLSLGAPILAGLAGRDPLPALANATASEAIPAPAHEDRLVAGTVTDGVFTPSAHLGSGMLRGLAQSTGFAVLPPGGVQPGDPVRWLPLPS